MFTEPIRLWIDGDFGSDPSRLAGLAYAILRDDIDVVGISISGKQQDKRYEETTALLEELETEIDIYREDELDIEHIEKAQPQVTLALGPLTNIAPLVVDEASIGKLYAMSGALRQVHQYVHTITIHPNIQADIDAARVVLSQYDTTLCPLEVSSQFILDHFKEKQIAKASPFFAARFDGYKQYLENKYSNQYGSIVLGDLCGIASIVKMPTIAVETVEYFFQADGSFLCEYQLESNPEPIEEKPNPLGFPAPTMKQDFIRRVDANRVLDDFLGLLSK